MSKITEERFKEIVLSLEIDYEQISILINHPEIKGLFEDERRNVTRCDTKCSKCKLTADECNEEPWLVIHKEIDLSTIDEGMINRYECPGCGILQVMNKEKPQCTYCRIKLSWPTNPTKESERLPDSGKTIELEYEVIEYSDKEGWCLTKCPNGSVPDEIYEEPVAHVNSGWCLRACKTNGKQNFKGHEVGGKSIKCAHKFNEGE